MESLQIVEHCVYAHGEQAWRLAVGLMGNAADADDVLQQSFIVAWRKSGSFPRGATWPWLAGIIAGEARNARRKRARRSHAELTETDAMIDPDPDIERAELGALLSKALLRLPDEQREALVLTHLSGMTHEQAAAALHISVNTLKSRVRRGLDAMREKLRSGDGEITLALAAMPVALPKAGFAAARVTWMASVKHYAAGAAAAGAGTAKIKTMALGTLAALLVVALMLWMFEEELGLRLTAPDVAEFEAPQSRVRETTSRERDRERAKGERRRPRRGTQGLPGEHDDGANRAAANDESLTPAGDPADNSHKGEVVGKEVDESEIDVPAPNASNFEAPDRVPVLWIEQWPPKARPHKPHTSNASRAVAYLERMWPDERYTNEQRVEALQAVPNGETRLVRIMLQALASERLNERLAAQAWVSREDNGKVLVELEKALLGLKNESDAAAQLLVPMFRNANWVNEEKWRATFKAWASGNPVHKLLTRRLIHELAHARGNPTGSKARENNRFRARLLLELAQEYERKKEERRDPEIGRALNLALECLMRAGYAGDKHRANAGRRLRAASAAPEVLMRLRRTMEVNGCVWKVTTIDVGGPRETDVPLIVLQDPDTAEDVWMPWMVEMDLHFRCYLFDYQIWTRDIANESPRDAESFKARGPEYVTRLAESLVELCRRLHLRKYVLVAPGIMGAVAMEACRQTGSEAVFACLDAWTSHQDLLLPLLESKDAAKDGPESLPVRDLLFLADAVACLTGSARAATPVEQSLTDEARFDQWLDRMPKIGGRSHDAYARSSEELVQFVRRHDPHPAALLSHYRFLDGERPRATLMVLKSPFFGRVGFRSAEKWDKVFDTRRHTPSEMTTGALWRDSPEVFVRAVMKVLEEEKLISKRKD